LGVRRGTSPNPEHKAHLLLATWSEVRGTRTLAARKEGLEVRARLGQPGACFQVPPLLAASFSELAVRAKIPKAVLCYGQSKGLLSGLKH
jgi:hypothetical protein